MKRRSNEGTTANEKATKEQRRTNEGTKGTKEARQQRRSNCGNEGNVTRAGVGGSRGGGWRCRERSRGREVERSRGRERNTQTQTHAHTATHTHNHGRTVERLCVLVYEVREEDAVLLNNWRRRWSVLQCAALPPQPVDGTRDRRQVVLMRVDV